jgi:hypothetical protein
MGLLLKFPTFRLLELYLQTPIFDLTQFLSLYKVSSRNASAYRASYITFELYLSRPNYPTAMAGTDSKELGVELATFDTEQGANKEIMIASIPVASLGTAYDQRDMRVMGKLQELRVRGLFCIHLHNC